MGRNFHNRVEKLPSCNITLLITFFLLATTLLTGCEDEHGRAWREWREEAGKVDYRCGMFADYEFKINRAYLFFWPTYKGRSDWEVQGPPPLSCSAQLETMPMEAYWPGLSPAGQHTAEEFNNPERIHIDLNSVGTLEKWDFVSNLERRFGMNWRETLQYQKNKDHLKLNYAKGGHWLFPKKIFDYYWIEETDGRISLFIECDFITTSKLPSCMQRQYIPEMQAVLIIKYKKSELKHWKNISRDVNIFINNAHTPIKPIMQNSLIRNHLYARRN